jgi:hypothetical protein
VSAVLRLCSAPGCARMQLEARCEVHRRAKTAARGYGGAWQATARSFLRARSECEYPGCSEPAREVHHVDGRPGHNDWANLRALCRAHHREVT